MVSNVNSGSVLTFDGKLFDIENTGISLLDKKALGRLLSISVKMIDKLVYAERVPYIKIGRLVRFSPVEIEKWLKERSHYGN